MADYRMPMDADGIKYHGTVDQNEENPGQFMYGLDENGNKRIIRTDENGNVLTRVTGSIEVLVDESYRSTNTRNMFFGSGYHTAAVYTEGLLVSDFKGLSLYIRNNTDDDFVINNIYQGTNRRPGSRNMKFFFGLNITITSGSSFFVDFRDADENLSDIQRYLTVSYPYLIFSIFNSDGLGEGTIDVAITGIK